MNVRKKTITDKRARAIAEAIHSMEPWALISRFLQPDCLAHASDQNRDELAGALDANYPGVILPADVRNAWDWFRIYGEDDWGSRALVAQRELEGRATDVFWAHQDWKKARMRLDEALFGVVETYLPAWPYEPLPGRVLDAYDELPTFRGYFLNRVPPASERARAAIMARG